MRAVVYDPAGPVHLALGEVPDPRPAPSAALIRVAATSLNFADVAFLRERQAAGAVPGFDASGVVIAGAGDGSGPVPGTRVVTFGWSGGWAELRAVDVGELAVVPDEVELGAAAAVPVAGVTALRRAATWLPHRAAGWSSPARPVGSDASRCSSRPKPAPT